ncbi:MAG: hypothetical protein ACQETL_12585 [Bacteroidota bacterium]
MYACNPNTEDEELMTAEDEFQSEELIKLGNANLEAQDVLIEMLQKEPDLRKELLKIGVKKEGVMLKTLFDPTTGGFQRLNPSLLTFKDKFTHYYHGKESGSQRASQKNNEDLEELIQTLVDGDVEIYMPYIEEEMLESSNITIVAATLENQGDEVEGYRVELSNSKNRNSLPYEEPKLVDVDDDYADENSTMILMPIDGGGGSTGGGSTGGGSTGVGSTGTEEIYDSLYRMHVQVAHMRCDKQYDRLVDFFTNNGGGSEFKFFRAKPEYNFSEDKVEAGTNQVQAELSRKQIREDDWVPQFVTWDYGWEPGEIEQGFAIYEWDNTDNEVTINGSVKMNLEVKADFDEIPIDFGNEKERSIGFEATYSSKHTVLEDQNMNREFFYHDIENKVDYGLGFYDGRQIRKAGSLEYTVNSLNYYKD